MSWIKKVLVGFANKKAHKLVSELDHFEDEIAGLIIKNVVPAQIAEEVINFVQEKLRKVSDKVFGFLAKILGGNIVKKIATEIDEEIEKLDSLEDDIAKLIEKNINPNIIAEKIVSKVQEELNKLIDKVIKI